jgi:AAA domain
VHFLTKVTLPNGTRLPFTMPRDMPLLSAKILETGACLVVVDPLVNYLDGKVNTHNDAQVRQALNELHEVAQETHAAIVCIRHFKKDRNETNLLHKGGGSIGIIGAMRGGLAVLADPDPAQTGRHYFGATKHNLTRGDAPTLAYQLVSVDTLVAGVQRQLSKVEWLGTDARSMSELSRAQADTPASAQNKSALHACFTFLEGLLGDGKWHRTTEVQRALLEAGHSERTWGRCRQQWTDLGKLERRRQPAKKEDDGTTTPAYWEVKLAWSPEDVELATEEGEEEEPNAQTDANADTPAAS